MYYIYSPSVLLTLSLSSSLCASLCYVSAGWCVGPGEPADVRVDDRGGQRLRTGLPRAQVPHRRYDEENIY
jgi:hypothetical protein